MVVVAAALLMGHRPSLHASFAAGTCNNGEHVAIERAWTS